MRKIILVLILLSAYCISIAQSKMDVTFILGENVNPPDIDISLNDGINSQFLNDSLGKSTFHMTNLYYGYYGHISIWYKKSGRVYEYFINDKPGKFILNVDSVDQGKSLNVIHSGGIINSVDSIENPIRYEYDNFLKNDSNHIAIVEIYKNYINEINKNDSIRNKLTTHTKLFNKKLLSFIEERNEDYYSFYLFKNYSKMQLEELLNDEDYMSSLRHQLNAFPKKYTDTKEGKILQQELQNKITPLEKWNFINFNFIDVKGIKYTIENLKSDYILLDFWATWCAPCITQIPDIKNLNKQYSLEKLQIISISADLDSANFSKVIEENEMNWVHIFDKNKDVARKFSIKAYPTLILIDKTGRLIFRSEGIMDKKRIIDIIEGRE